MRVGRRCKEVFYDCGQSNHRAAGLLETKKLTWMRPRLEIHTAAQILGQSSGHLPDFMIAWLDWPYESGNKPLTEGDCSNDDRRWKSPDRTVGA